MSEVDQNLSNILNTDYVPVVRENDKPVTIHQSQENNPDADYSRSNYYNLIEKGNEALDGILEVAKESQHPRAYEVAANMIKNLSTKWLWSGTETIRISQAYTSFHPKNSNEAMMPSS